MRLFALHGFAGTPTAWETVAPAGTELVAPWLPGHGPRPAVVGDFDDVVAELARAIERPCVLAGYSLGARLALAIALAFPDGIERVVLFGGTPGLADEGTRTSRRKWDEAQARAIESDIERWADDWAHLPIFASQRALPKPLRAAQQRHRCAHDPTGLAWAMRTLGQGAMPSLWSRLDALSCPTSFVAGAHDEKYVAIAESAAAMSLRVTAETIPECGHNPLLEHPAAVAARLRLALSG